MLRLALTLATPTENLALDEALLDWAEADEPDTEYLRIWESPHPIVVVGRSSRLEQEVDVEACDERGIPILRRSSGGAAIVAGPGCLMFAVVLSYQLRPELRDIRRAHCVILGRLADALRPHFLPAADVKQAGTSDLVLIEACATGSTRLSSPKSASALLDDANQHTQSRRHPAGPPRKFSGNSLRAKRSHLLYHGTLLYDFDLSLIESCLKLPPRQPEYRHARSHRDFVTNLPVARDTLTQAIDAAWPTQEEIDEWPQERVATLVAERFSRDGWNFEFGT
jgi:lipoate---protein ligase